MSIDWAGLAALVGAIYAVIKSLAKVSYAPFWWRHKYVMVKRLANLRGGLVAAGSANAGKLDVMLDRAMDDLIEVDQAMTRRKATGDKWYKHAVYLLLVASCWLGVATIIYSVGVYYDSYAYFRATSDSVHAAVLLFTTIALSMFLAFLTAALLTWVKDKILDQWNRRHH